ncbi:MAG: hypothetical protein G01um101419_612 [Parcubacteria group bacterium Gr01-1014_19]|nr:MAG: hypothetical protein G01um101419_612 [Parcubacteria group bacterium Gr01-1014_19]
MGASTPAQVEYLIELRFHEAAGWSEGDLETIAGRPESKDAILVVSELMVPIAKQCQLSGVNNRLRSHQLATHKNVAPLPEKLLYWCYDIDDGRKMKGFAPEEAIQKLSDEKRFPAHTALVLAIIRMDIQIISGNHRIDVGGSRIERDLIPAILLANGHPEHDRPTLSSTPLSEKKGYSTYGMASYAKAK